MCIRDRYEAQPASGSTLSYLLASYIQVGDLYQIIFASSVFLVKNNNDQVSVTSVKIRKTKDRGMLLSPMVVVAVLLIVHFINDRLLVLRARNSH